MDDDPLLIKSLRDTLESDGHAVTTATGGQAGIDAFMAALQKGQSFAVVISDLGMPNVDADAKVSRAIKEASPATPIILLTGWGQRLVTEKAIFRRMWTANPEQAAEITRTARSPGSMPGIFQAAKQEQRNSLILP